MEDAAEDEFQNLIWNNELLSNGSIWELKPNKNWNPVHPTEGSFYSYEEALLQQYVVK